MRPANSASRSPPVASPFHWTARCAGSRNSGRAMRVTRGARKISMQVSGVRCPVSGLPGQLQLRRAPGGVALERAQSGGNVRGDWCGVVPDLQVRERRPIGRGEYNTGVEDGPRVVGRLQAAEMAHPLGAGEPLARGGAQPAVPMLTARRTAEAHEEILHLVVEGLQRLAPAR